MELVIKDIRSAEDLKLFTGLAKRLGLKTAKLSDEEKKNIEEEGEIRLLTCLKMLRLGG